MSRSERAAPCTVLVVDDSAFMRRMVSDIVGSSGEFTVVGTARDGGDALRQVHALKPDIVTLDVQMPGLNGLDALGYIMSEVPRAVVMLSAGGADGGAAMTLRALELGAVDFVRKPSGPISLDVERVRDELLGALRATSCTNLRGVNVLARLVQLQTVHSRKAAIAAQQRAQRAVCIASSTGGPAALTQVIPRLSRDLDAAVLIVQHMPKDFTASLAQRLNGLGPLAVSEAVPGEMLMAGHVYVAPGGSHMRVEGVPGNARLVFADDPAVWGVRPAADPLFQCVAGVFGAACVGVVLTGMGGDGAEGLRLIRATGGVGIVQNAESAVIAGMPSAALRHAGADYVVALDAVAHAITSAVAALRPGPCTQRGRDIVAAGQA